MFNENVEFLQHSKDFVLSSHIVGLPKVLTSMLSHDNPVNSTLHHLMKREAGEARFFNSGCTDAFTAFAFLAFLLALLDLILELQSARRRKREDTTSMFDYMSNISVKEKNATLAAHYIFRGFLNSMDAEDENCANFMFCEASQNAAKYGEVGKSIAKISSFKAEEYLLNFDEDLFKDISTSGLVGILHNCTDVYGACQNVPNSYRFPGKSNLSTLSKYISLIDDEVVKTMKTHEEIP